MIRLVSTFCLLCCCPVSASLPPNSPGRSDQAALVNRWGHVLDGYSYTHEPLGLRTNITRNFGLTTNSVTVGYDLIGQHPGHPGRHQDQVQSAAE